MAAERACCQLTRKRHGLAGRGGQARSAVDGIYIYTYVVYCTCKHGERARSGQVDGVRVDRWCRVAPEAACFAPFCSTVRK